LTIIPINAYEEFNQEMDQAQSAMVWAVVAKGTKLNENSSKKHKRKIHDNLEEKSGK
jgi:hypothetical protein